MSKKESQARADRRERRRSQNRRQTLVWNLIVLGTLGAFLLLVAWFVVANLRPGPLPGEIEVADEGVGHLAEGATLPVFQHDPPASGTHYAQAAPWGLAAAPVPPGTYLHNLGIGGVVFLYKCSTPCPDLEAKFLVLYKKAPPDSLTGQRKILITPYEKDLPPSAVIVALAWDHRLNLAQFNEALMLRWYKRFVNQGPEPAQ